VAVRENVLEDLIAYQANYPVYLYIHLGAGSDVFHGNTSFEMPFKVYQNPTVNEWGPVRDFKIYDGETHIRITVRIGTLVMALIPVTRS